MEKRRSILLALILCITAASCIPDDKQEPESKAVGRKDAVPAAETAPITLLTNGMAEAEVYRLVGDPKGTFTTDSRTFLIYEGAQIPIENGVVIGLPDNFKSVYTAELERIQKSRQPKDENSGGFWSRFEKDDRQKKEAAAKKAYVLKNNNGQPVNHDALVHPGKVTVVDFYADWCGPCRAIAPHLAALMRNHPDAVLKKVDIGNWGSAVCNRYAVHSVPNLRVFDRYGNLVAKPTSSLDAVEQSIRTAMKR